MEQLKTIETADNGKKKSVSVMLNRKEFTGECTKYSQKFPLNFANTKANLCHTNYLLNQ